LTGKAVDTERDSCQIKPLGIGVLSDVSIEQGRLHFLGVRFDTYFVQQIFTFRDEFLNRT
jgi:hypothetical protein